MLKKPQTQLQKKGKQVQQASDFSNKENLMQHLDWHYIIKYAKITAECNHSSKTFCIRCLYVENEQEISYVCMYHLPAMKYFLC